MILWDEYYSVNNTHYLILKNDDLSFLSKDRIIPPRIGNLVNLVNLSLSNNQLAGTIPSEICNQGDKTPTLKNNRFCPPYPSCIEDYISTQDTTSCN